MQRAAGRSLLVGKLYITKAFDNTDLNFAEEAAQHFAGTGFAYAPPAGTSLGKACASDSGNQIEGKCDQAARNLPRCSDITNDLHLDDGTPRLAGLDNEGQTRMMWSLDRGETPFQIVMGR